jgi:hypothetical protein
MAPATVTDASSGGHPSTRTLLPEGHAQLRPDRTLALNMEHDAHRRRALLVAELLDTPMTELDGVTALAR